MNSEIIKIKKENEYLVKHADQADQIKDAEANNETQKNITKKLNIELNEARSRKQLEIAEIRKSFKSEVKQWKKELG